MNKALLKCLMLTLLLATATHCRAGEELFDVDSKFRAKIAKEKLKQSAREREQDKSSTAGAADSSNCGSQNIGNVDTRGRTGGAPREVFVFAPNAINLVGSGGCR